MHQPKTHLDLDHLDQKFVCVMRVMHVVHSSSLQTPRQVDRQADRYEPPRTMTLNHYEPPRTMTLNHYEPPQTMTLNHNEPLRTTTNHYEPL